MENVIKFEVIDETSEEQNSILLPESHSINTVMEVTNIEFDQSTVDIEANNQQSGGISPGLEEESEDRAQFLFAPVNHRMRRDPELIRLESEKSSLDQEAATKVINDRYKLIMEVSARRKEKIQRDKMKSIEIAQKMARELDLKTTQLSHYVDGEDIKKTTQLLYNMHMDPVNVLKTTQPSHSMGSEDVKNTTQLLHNMNLTPRSLTTDQSEEFSDCHLEKIYWHRDLNRFIKLNYSEINTTANISSIDMLNTVTEHHESRVEDAQNRMRNEQKDGVKRMAFFQASQKLGSAKRKKTTQIFCDEFIATSFEDLLGERSGWP